jgi:hypothetical protein
LGIGRLFSVLAGCRPGRKDIRYFTVGGGWPGDFRRVEIGPGGTYSAIFFSKAALVFRNSSTREIKKAGVFCGLGRPGLANDRLFYIF